jgi:hypothetical protein
MQLSRNQKALSIVDIKEALKKIDKNLNDHKAISAAKTLMKVKKKKIF